MLQRDTLGLSGEHDGGLGVRTGGKGRESG